MKTSIFLFPLPLSLFASKVSILNYGTKQTLDFSTTKKDSHVTFALRDKDRQRKLSHSMVFLGLVPG